MSSEYYPHEFIHLIVPKFERHGLIVEGFITWKGGQDGKTFENSVRLMANELANNHKLTFSDNINKKWGWKYAAFYTTTGAIFCNSAYKKGGVNLVNALLKIPNDNIKKLENLCSIFDIEKKDFDDF